MVDWKVDPMVDGTACMTVLLKDESMADEKVDR